MPSPISSLVVHRPVTVAGLFVAVEVTIHLGVKNALGEDFVRSSMRPLGSKIVFGSVPARRWSAITPGAILSRQAMGNILFSSHYAHHDTKSLIILNSCSRRAFANTGPALFLT
jgi:hypothetical protein